jgi:sortase (surface protein transpeptidase)
VLEEMCECWPKAADWHVVDDDHVQILDNKDRVLGVITCDDLSRIWNGCE